MPKIGRIYFNRRNLSALEIVCPGKRNIHCLVVAAGFFKVYAYAKFVVVVKGVFYCWAYGKVKVCLVSKDIVVGRKVKGHKADLAEDYQVLKNIYENHLKAEIVDNWVKEKQRTTYVFIDENWRNCEFKYPWMNSGK